MCTGLTRFRMRVKLVSPAYWGLRIIFHHTAHKVRTVCPAGEKHPRHFTLLVEKISICTTGESEESLRSHVRPPRLRLG